MKFVLEKSILVGGYLEVRRSNEEIAIAIDQVKEKSCPRFRKRCISKMFGNLRISKCCSLTIPFLYHLYQFYGCSILSYVSLRIPIRGYFLFFFFNIVLFSELSVFSLVICLFGFVYLGLLLRLQVFLKYLDHP